MHGCPDHGQIRSLAHAWSADAGLMDIRPARRFAASAGHRAATLVVKRGQNDSVPLDVSISTSCSAGLSNAQLPSGLRGATPRPVSVPVKLPVASVNCLVPPVICAVDVAVAVATQLSGLMENGPPVGVVRRCMVPSG